MNINTAFIAWLVAPYLDEIQQHMDFMEGLDRTYEEHKRNVWVQQIKANGKRNRKKQRRCKRKGT